jgi:hypothetical protein
MENRQLVQTPVSTLPRKAVAFSKSLTIDDPDESRRVSRGRRIAPVMLSDHITCPLRKMNPMGALLIAQP